MNLWNETKSIPISRQEVWQAYKKVRSNKGSAGVDAVSMEEYDANRSKHLYKLWNRMASGSYFPPPVKEVEILKKDGKVRKLGIPTISDRVGQMVIKQMLEPRLEKIFSNNSYGYRPQKNAHQALEEVRKNCWKTDWVIDLDIKGFFDNIDHEKLMLAVNKHVPENWIRFYIERWLKAPRLTKSGELITNQGKGTPQGGVISPLLANLFLHYVLDKWLEQTDKTVKYVRYADDVIIHCVSKAQAEQMLKSLQERMNSVGLELHPQKTKIVYCKDYRRKGKYPIVKFDFLGYSFQPRTTKSKKTKGLFLGFDCAISISSRKRIADKLGELEVEKLSFKSIVGIAQYLNPMIRGWINYYGKFRPSELHKIFRLLRNRLLRWARNRYKRYKTSVGY
jgi:group II intron reverse transcriptase/maturase